MNNSYSEYITYLIDEAKNEQSINTVIYVLQEIFDEMKKLQNRVDELEKMK